MKQWKFEAEGLGAQPLKPEATAYTVHIKSFEVEKFHRLLLS